MRSLALLATAASAAIAAPAAATAVHQTSVAHAGSTFSVTYEPRRALDLRQTGLGPRTQAMCMWKSQVSVERRLADDAGRPVQALTRTLGEHTLAEGMVLGYCANLSERDKAGLGGSAEKMRALASRAAERDRDGLHAELASVGALGHTAAR